MPSVAPFPFATRRRLGALALLTVLAAGAGAAEPAGRQPVAADWPQLGGSSLRNNTPQAAGLPVEWKIGKFDRKTGAWLSEGAKNVKWVARLGSVCYGTPVVAGPRVFCGTNNAAGYLKRYSKDVDLGCLLCFDRRDGRFLWQFSAEKLAGGDTVDYKEQGVCAAPLVEGDRAWLVSNRCEVVCLDTAGGGRDAGGAAQPHEARVLWRYDMMGQLGVVPRYMSACSVTAFGDLLVVCTSNGVVPETGPGAKSVIPAPDAPSFIALDKHSGKLVWADASPGKNLLEGQWSSPACAVLGGVAQAIFAGGDGWVYSFLAEPAADKKPKLLWKFDCNPKDAVWGGGGKGRRNNILSTPVLCDGRVYVATGQEPEAQQGPADLWCIDPTRRGDVSPEMAVDPQGNPVAPARAAALNKQLGQKAVKNPNSAAVWHYAGRDPSGASKKFEDVFHRTLGTPVVKDGLLVVADLDGVVHCVDAKTGEPCWTHDLKCGGVWGSPLAADGKLYLGTQDGDVAVFELGRKCKLLAQNPMGDPVSTGIVAVGDTLYIATHTRLFAIASAKPASAMGE